MTLNSANTYKNFYSSNAMTIDFKKNKIVLGEDFQKNIHFGKFGIDIIIKEDKLTFIVSKKLDKHTPAIYKKVESFSKLILKTNKVQNILAYLSTFEEYENTDKVEIFFEDWNNKCEESKVKVKKFSTKLDAEIKNKYAQVTYLNYTSNVIVNEVQ